MISTLFLCVVASAFVSFCVTVYGGHRIKRRAFREADQATLKAMELTETLVEVMDEDGNVRGQLMLPGKVPTDEAMERLETATASLEKGRREFIEFKDKARKEANKYRKAVGQLTEQLELVQLQKEKLERTLAEVVDTDGTVLAQLRLPGEVVKPNRTPCGLCVHSDGEDFCEAGLEEDHIARPNFLDVDHQCVMYERRA